MALRDLLDSTGKEKKRKERAKATRDIAIGVGIATFSAAAGIATGMLIAPKSGRETRKDMKDNTLSFNNAVEKRAKAFKKSTAHSAQMVGDAIKEVHEKSGSIGSDIKAGLHEIKQDIHHAAAAVSNEFDNH